MKKVYQFLAVACLVIMVLFVNQLAMAADYITMIDRSGYDLESSLRFKLKNGAKITVIKLEHEINTDNTINELEELLESQRNEELLLALLEEEKNCKDDETLKLFFGNEYAHCR